MKYFRKIRKETDVNNVPDIKTELLSCRERLSRLCINLCRDYHDASDLYQDTCLRAFKYFKSYDGSMEFEKWIFRICVNTYKSTLRKFYSHRPVAFGNAEEHDQFFSMIPQEDNIPNEEYETLLEVIDKLPDKYRTVILLRYFNDHSEKDAAQILGIPEGTVKSRLNKAKQLIRKEMDH